MNTAKWQDTKPTHTDQLCFYTLTVSNLERKLRKQYYLQCIKNNKILRNKLNQEDERLYTENYKTLLKEIKGINKWKDILCS